MPPKKATATAKAKSRPKLKKSERQALRAVAAKERAFIEAFHGECAAKKVRIKNEKELQLEKLEAACKKRIRAATKSHNANLRKAKGKPAKNKS